MAYRADFFNIVEDFAEKMVELRRAESAVRISALLALQPELGSGGSGTGTVSGLQT
jgi:hypothetical protein